MKFNTNKYLYNIFTVIFMYMYVYHSIGVFLTTVKYEVRLPGKMMPVSFPPS